MRANRRRASRRRLSLLRTSVLLLLGFAVSGLAGAAAYFLPLLTTTLGTTGQPVPAEARSASPSPAPAPGAPFTVLLLGSDNDQKFDTKTLLTQSMILVRVDPSTKQVTMLSIPRDLYVPLYVPNPGGSGRVDEAYSYGGAAAAIATVERNFKVHVDDYIWIGLKGLIDVIDRMQGVDVVTSNPVLDDYYPADLVGNNPYGYQRVAVLPGAQHLDGYHALLYVRSRHSDLRGDFGRSQRQQQVLLALRAKAKTMNPADLPDLASAFKDELKTSMSPARVAQLLPLTASLNPDGIRQVTLFGDFTHLEVINGADVQVPNWQLINPLVHQTFPVA